MHRSTLVASAAFVLTAGVAVLAIAQDAPAPAAPATTQPASAAPAPPGAPAAPAAPAAPGAAAQPASAVFGSQPAPAPAIDIVKLQTTIFTTGEKNAGTEADLWLACSVRMPANNPNAVTLGATKFLMRGIEDNANKTSPILELRNSFNQSMLGGLTLVNAMDQFSPDLAVKRIVVRGADMQGRWWTIADHTYATSERHWLNNDPKSNDDQGPALQIPTLPTWTPAEAPAPAKGGDEK